MIDFTWVAAFFLPFAVIFALVFSVGIMVFLFYDLVRTAEERRKGGQTPNPSPAHTPTPTTTLAATSTITSATTSATTLTNTPAGAAQKVSKFVSIPLLKLVRGIRRKKAAPSTAPPALVGAEPEVAGAAPSGLAAPPPAPPPASASTSTPVPVPNPPPATTLPTPAPGGNEVKIKPVQSLSELDAILSKKEGVPPTSAETAVATTASSPAPSAVPAPASAVAASGAANTSAAKPPVDSDDVLALLGGAVVSSDKEGSESGKEPRKELKQEPKVPDKKEGGANITAGTGPSASADLGYGADAGSGTVVASPSVKGKEVAPEGEPLGEVASLLKGDEPADKAKELSTQISELRSSLFELREKLKRMARSESEVANLDPNEGA